MCVCVYVDNFNPLDQWACTGLWAGLHFVISAFL
jgi:hypothetical protein